MSNLTLLLKKYNNVLQNFSYLTILQVFNIFFPVIIYPFLIDLLGLELWGKIILAQSLALYVSLFVDFGFDRYATKEVSIFRNDAENLSQIVSCVVLLRLALGILAFALYFLVIFNVVFFKGDEVLYLLFFGLNFNFILFPKWFFQGIEQMKYIVIINVSIKLVFVFLMFLMIETRDDYLYVPLFFSLGAMVGGAIGLGIMLGFKKVQFRLYKFTTYYHYLKKSYLLFASSLVVSIKDRFNIFIVGYFLGMQEVALYDISIKMISIITQPVESINGAIFPKVSKELNMTFVKKVAFYTLLFVLSLLLVVQLFLYDIFSFLNIDEPQNVGSIRLVLLSAPFLTLSVFLARNCFIVNNKFNLLFRSMVWTTVFYSCLIAILFFVGHLTFRYILIVVFLVYLFEFLYRYFIAKQNNLISMKFREKIGRYYYGKGTFGFIMKPLVFVYDLWRHRIMDERTFIQNRFKRRMGYELNLDNPKTLNEKIQWLKLYDRTSLHTIAADKYAVRNYVEEKIGKQYLIPLYYDTQRPSDINVENLPDLPVIIKTNHDSSGGIIVKDKSLVNWKEIQDEFEKRLKKNFYYGSKEWQYKEIEPKIIVEKLLTTEEGNIPFDYKLHCFNGKLAFTQVDIDRQTNHCRNLYDESWNFIECTWKYKNGENIQKPHEYELMRSLAETLAKDFIYVRVDFYCVKGKVYFGELTFHSESGNGIFTPKYFDEKFGNMLKLPK